jgi:hypothetical protein
MRKIRWLWFPLIVGLVLLLPWILFHLRSERPLSVVVLDKTVPFDTYLEHAGFFWLLDQLKIVQPSGDRYDRSVDYLGATPGPEPGDPPARTRDLTDGDAQDADLLYVIDTYGVYEEDLESGEEKKAALERSNKLYGGLTTEEALVLASARKRGTTIVAEFNSMASPTGHEAAAVLEQLVGVRWTRWIGRYFPLLEDREEVPQWLRDVCQRELNQAWTFSGPGYVLIQDDVRCEVLLAGSDSPPIGLTIEPEPEARKGVLRKAATGTPYTFWFDLVIPGPETEVLASYQWGLNGPGNAKLRRLGLPQRFPAVTRHRDAAGVPAYYFAGDFGDSTLNEGRVPLAGFLAFRRWIEKTRRIPSHPAFYHRFYVPLMTEILADAEKASRGRR